MTMQFKSLRIAMPERWEPGFKDGIPRGEIEMEGEHGKVAVKLTGQQCRAILAIVGQAAKDTTEEAVKAMTAEVFNLPTPALIAMVQDEGQRKELTAIYDRRAAELNA